MAAPTNTDATTATDLGTLPATITQDVHDAGTTYTVWYKFTAPAGSVVIGAFGFGDLVTYRPTIRPYSGPAASPVQILSIAGQNKAIQFPVTAGSEYFLKLTTNGGNPSPASLSLNVQAHAELATPAGSILVPDDTEGFPAAIINPTTGEVLKYVYPFPAGEQGDALETGAFLVNDNSGTDVHLYDSAFVEQATLDPFPSNGANMRRIRVSPALQTFYVGTAGGAAADITTVSSAGVLGATTWTLPASGMTALAPNNDGSLVYVSGQTASTNTPIKRWQTGSSSFASDLIAAQGASTSVSDILVLSDDTIVAVWRHSGTSAVTVRHMATDGTVLASYATTSSSAGTRLAYDSADYQTFVWLWTHSSGVSTFHKITVATMTAASTVSGTDFETGVYQAAETATPTDRFGFSFSCPFLLLREAAEDDEEVDPPTQTPTATTNTDCPCPPPDGGSSGPTGSGPTGTGPIGGGGSGKSGPNEGGSGWTPDALCDGGGTVSSYPVASAGESMVGVREPRVWADVAFVEFAADDTETAASVYWSLHVPMPDLPSAYGGRKDGRALGISRISRGMSDDNGNYSGSKVTVDVDDKDRNALRTRLGGATTKYVWEREGVIRIASETNRRSGYATAPRELYRGVTHDVQIDKRFTGSLSFEDKLCSQFGRFGPDRSFSSRLLTLGMLPACPREIVGKPQQWVFGEVSDEGATDPATGAAASKGLVPIWLVGSDATSDHYHVAAHEIGALTLYGSDGGDPATRVLLSEGSDYTVEVLNLLDSETGLTHRVTHILCPIGSVHSEAHKAGRLNMAANVCGVLGANGLVIKDLFKIYQYIFEHLVLPEQESLTGAYVGAPQWADGRYMVHSDSFEQAQDFSITRIGSAGYQGGFVLGGPGQGAVTLRELLRRMSNSGDCWFTWTAAGQLKVLLLDDAQNVDGVDILTEPAGLRALPTPEFAPDEVENPVLFSYDYDDDKKKFRVAQEKDENAAAIRRMGRPKPSPSPIQMRCIREPETARDIAARRLLRRQYPPAYYPIVEPLDGLDRDPGDVVKVTSQEGVGDGCDERAMWIKETSFNLKTMRVTHLCRDLTDILGTAAFWGPDGLTTYDAEDASDQADYAFWADEDDLVGAVAAKGWS